MRRIAIGTYVATAMCLCAVIACTANVEAASYQLSKQGELGYNQYHIIADFNAQYGAQISYQVTGLGDAPLDVLIIEATYLDAYIAGPDFQYLPCSCLSDSHPQMTTSFGTFETGREYILLIDNSNDPAGGAMALGTVEFSYTVELQNVELVGYMDTSAFDVIVPLVMFGGFIVIFVVIVIMSRRGRNTYKKARLKQCTSCHEQVPEQNTVCPKCGGNL